MLESDLKESLIKLSEDINKILTLKCVIIFGSRARNNYTKESDLDMIFVGDFKEPFINRSEIVYQHYKIPLGLDAFCYNPDEFDKMFHEGVVSILDSIDHGICIFGKKFFRLYREKLERLKQRGLKRDPPVWILPESMY